MMEERRRWRERYVHPHKILGATTSKIAGGADTRTALRCDGAESSAFLSEPPPPPPNKFSVGGMASEPSADLDNPNAATSRDRIATAVPKAVSVSETTVRDVFDRIHALAPAGAPRPWATKETLEEVRAVLREGISPAEVIDLARGAAEVISAGGQDPKWYTVRNLLREGTRTRWLADIAALRAKRRKIQAVGVQLELVPEEPQEPEWLRRIRGRS